ncbi:hypothetical protein ACIBP6_17045 [Nonomuraea terrae]|uniref:hypothetical protein n=1 Tax=Nonomuraea terrae TaxID=2530383 RepID=UPI00379658F1
MGDRTGGVEEGGGTDAKVGGGAEVEVGDGAGGEEGGAGAVVGGSLGEDSGARSPSAAVQGRRGIVWRECGDELECGTLSVPVDWARPRGLRTQIDLARMPARDPYRSLGALVVNTGAPSTIQDVRARPDTVSELTRWFDVVLVEPRGIGDRGSRAMVRCSVPPPDPVLLQLTPGRASWRSYARQNAAYGKSCRIAAGPAYGGLTARQVAHDLDAVRAALGERRLRYFGNGYGAVYGRAYLELFPRRVERMYLEGVPDLGEPSLERRATTRARAAERRLGHFRDWCRSRLGCPLDADAPAVIDDLYERAPLPAGPGRTLDARGVAAAVYAGLDPGRWPELARALAQAEEGDAAALAAMTVVPPPAGPATVTRAAECRDFAPAVPDHAQLVAMEERLRALAPRVGWLSARHEAARCLGLPGPAQSPGTPRLTGALRLPEDASVLIGVGRLDTGAARVPGAAVLRHGDGHGAYLLQGVAKLRAACLRTRVHAYLVNGVRPRSSCSGELVADP